MTTKVPSGPVAKQVWKIVRNEGGMLWSAHFAQFPNRRLSAIYKQTEWTEPAIGKLFVFGNHSAARMALNDYYQEYNLRGPGDTFQLWEAVAEGCEYRRLVLNTNGVDNPAILETWWNGTRKEQQACRNYQICAPNATMVCDRVRLLKRLVVRV